MTAGRGQRVLVTPRSLTQVGLDRVTALDPLRDSGFELVSGPAGRLPTDEEQRALVAGCVAWLAGVERIGAATLAVASDLRVISRNGTGTDGIDLAAADERGVQVVRAAGANARGVAELALALALSGLRHIPWSAASVAAGGWSRTQGRELGDCTVGVVGMGAIGRLVAQLFSAVGARVVAHDPYADLGGSGVEPLALDDLLAAADVVTLHLPPPADGALLDAERLTRVREGAVLVNTARSALVDDDAVLQALGSGRLSAYAVDAYDEEPPPPSPLLAHPRVIATPHVGGYTGASVRRATEQAVSGMLEALEGTGR